MFVKAGALSSSLYLISCLVPSGKVIVKIKLSGFKIGVGNGSAFDACTNGIEIPAAKAAEIAVAQKVPQRTFLLLAFCSVVLVFLIF